MDTSHDKYNNELYYLKINYDKNYEVDYKQSVWRMRSEIHRHRVYTTCM